jgi:transketolase
LATLFRLWGLHSLNMKLTPLDSKAIAQRRQILHIMEKSQRGHFGAALSVMEIVRVLYDKILRYDSRKPLWPDRDRFIFSKGHGCLALYVVLAEKGFFPVAELDRVCHFGAMLGGHPESRKTPGVEASTGSLGHGLPIGLGMALAARIDHQSHRVFVLIGDGESNEGSVWEAALCAGKHHLENLVVLLDYNRMQSYGTTKEVQDLEPLADKWRSFNFGVEEVDGHDPAQLESILQRVPFAPGKPSVLICHTIKGRGFACAEGNPDWHHKAKISPEEVERLRKELENTR